MTSRRLAILTLATTIAMVAPASADVRSDILRVAGETPIVRVVAPGGDVLLDIGGDRSFLPASTMKVFTVLLAAKHLDMDFRFETAFFLDGERLVVKGSGDPYLISEELDLIAGALKPKLEGRTLSGIWIDDSAFEQGIVMPGVGKSERPYDALNSATAVNFNQINVKWDGSDYISAEEQTPITPLARQRARAAGIRGEDRINLSTDPNDVRRYVSELIAAKLRQLGLRIGDQHGSSASPSSSPIYVHRNSRPLSEVCNQLLYWSNNYITNQVFLTVGAAVHGYPANLDKSLRVARSFLEEHPKLSGLKVAEGSGISYENSATASSLIALLDLFEPHRGLLRLHEGTPHKTGTLRVSKTVIGYHDSPERGRLKFVIALDRNGYSRKWKVLKAIKKHF
ncbi:MAG: D-alanyl-D-alanine carboxypeptidase [Myxococcota bacterium]|nr:D-alanyl-D-alanine carboxypeptidase [Myxococcota bacterium]